MTDNPTILVQHRHPHARGQQVAGVGGRVYHVSPTGMLHAIRGGIVSDQPGCHPECAARFAQFTDTFRRHRPTPPSTPPTPPPAPLPVEEEASEIAAGGPAPLSDLDLSVLDGSVSALRRALDTGDHDEHLESLMAAEEAGKTRKSAVAAIRDRIDGLED